ncbi:hypothetical protein D9M71_741870 [compost metagenome]
MLEHARIFQWLDQIVGGAQAQGLDRIAHHPGRRDHDDRHVAVEFGNPLNQPPTIELRGVQVADHQIRLLLLEQLQAATAGGRFQQAETRIFEAGAQAGAHLFVGINDQQLGTDCVHESSRQTAPHAAQKTG